MMEGLRLVLNEHRLNFKNIVEMAIKDLKKQYAGTAIGWLWSIVKNIIYVFAYWFMVEVGLRGTSGVEYPYMIWLITGLAAWFFINGTLVPAASSIRKNKYLVTKMVYPVSIIPTFKVISSFISNLGFMVVVFAVAVLSRVAPSIYWVQILYYQFAAIVLLSAISLLTSALVVFSRDIEMLIKSTVFLLFWLSPILYPVDNLSGTLAFVMRLNPFVYIVEGFRASILYKEWFWMSPGQTVYFWVITFIVLMLGVFVHGKLRNQFADVL